MTLSTAPIWEERKYRASRKEGCGAFSLVQQMGAEVPCHRLRRSLHGGVSSIQDYECNLLPSSPFVGAFDDSSSDRPLLFNFGVSDPVPAILYDVLVS